MRDTLIARSWFLAVLVVAAAVTPFVGGATLGPGFGVDVTGQTSGPVQPPLQEAVIRDVNNQVATEDGTVGVRGIARGQDRVLVVFIDRRGRIASTILSVDDDDVFEEDDVPLVTRDGDDLSEGPVVATVFGVGRDGVVGDGEIEGFTRSDLEALDESTRQKIRKRVKEGGAVRTQQQVLELFYDESVGDAGSDDLILADTFTYTDGPTSIESVVAARANETRPGPLSSGDTMVVQGITNRRPDDNTITVEVIDGPGADLFDTSATDEWDTDGVWSVTIDVPRDAEPGTYTVESDDGDQTDRVQIQIRPERGNETTGTEALT